MTVKHLQQIQRQQLASAVAADPGVIMRFKNGFDECAAEVSRYISRLDGVDNGVKQRLTAHLHRCVSSIQHISTFPHQSMFSTFNQNCDKNTIVLPNVPAIPEDVNNNNNNNQNVERIQIPNGLHLIPSRLPTGELALLVPNSNHMSTFLNATAGNTFQFSSNTNVTSVLNPILGGTLNSTSNYPSAFTAVNKNQEYPSPTSTADIIKKEPNLSEKDDLKSSSYLNRSTDQSSYNQNYNFKVTESLNGGKTMTDNQEYKNSNLINGQDLHEGSRNYDKYETFPCKSLDESDYDNKISQRASSSSFQRNAADSTTSFTQIKEETVETGFKPFHVDIPNSHLKAHISLSKNINEIKTPLQIQHKPNPNFTINPNKLYQKSSPHKFSRYYSNVESSYSDVGKPDTAFDNISKRDENNDVNDYPGRDYTVSTNGKLTSSQEETTATTTTTTKITENLYKNGKRSFHNESSDMIPATTSAEPQNKIQRISLNVTLTDDQSKSEQNNKNRCKRISVIVEDSSKNNTKENNKEIQMSVSSQKDMWRPW